LGAERAGLRALRTPFFDAVTLNDARNAPKTVIMMPIMVYDTSPEEGGYCKRKEKGEKKKVRSRRRKRNKPIA
jgi:hypothetical protein